MGVSPPRLRTRRLSSLTLALVGAALLIGNLVVLAVYQSSRAKEARNLVSSSCLDLRAFVQSDHRDRVALDRAAKEARGAGGRSSEYLLFAQEVGALRTTVRVHPEGHLPTTGFDEVERICGLPVLNRPSAPPSG